MSRRRSGIRVLGPRLEALLESAKAAERAGDWEEALAAYERAFRRLPREGSAREACELLRWLGRVHRQRGDVELAAEAYEASLAIAEAAGLRADIAWALNSIGVLVQFTGGLDSAESYYIRAWRIADELGEQRLAAMTQQNLGTLATIRGDFETAFLCYRAALDSFRLLPDELACAWTLNNLAMAKVDMGEWHAAEALFDQAFDLADRLGDAGALGSVEINRAELYLKRREFGRAREGCDHAFEIFSRAGSKLWLAEAYKFYGVLYRETAKPRLAQRHFADAVALAQASRNRLLEAEAQSEWAVLHLTEQRNTEALGCLNRAHRLFAELHAGRELIDLDRRLDGLEAMYLKVTEAWGDSIESKDRYTAGHCRRVADSACMLAQAVGISGRELAWFRMGAFLHDVGKIEIPEAVLNKPGKFTAEEWERMKRHTLAGDAIVSELNFPWDVRPIVRSHHERWDGTGYPDGLAGQSIPFHARILCVADVFDALTTTRSYRPALPRDEALAIMAADAGKLFDPELFRRFRELLEGEFAPAAPRSHLTIVA